jgi:hypothetical protein
MKLHVIVTAFNRPTDLKRLVYDFILQTNPNWDMRIIHDGPPPAGLEEEINAFKDPRVSFHYTDPVKGAWGHHNRSEFLNNTKGNRGDYVLITNDDNQYVKAFIEIFLNVCKPDVGFVFCNTIHNYFNYDTLLTQIRVGAIDMGSFIVKLDVAQRTGFNSRLEVADGIYAEECAAECVRKELKILRINKSLFIHN